MMSRATAATLAILALAMLVAGIAVAEETPSGDDIAGWVKDLDSDAFKTRQQASERLFAAGKAAIGPLEKAADGDSLEVTSRSISILGRLLNSEDTATKSSAAEALTRLAKSESPSVAGRAKALIDPEPAKPDPAAPRPGRVRVGGFGIARLGLRITTRTVDGNKVIEAEEGDKKTKIEESAAGKIKMQVTEKVDGKEKTSEYEADSADDLKKKHPDAHKLYEKYSKGVGGIVLRLGGGIGGLPGGIRPAKAIRIGVIPAKALEEIDAARKQLDEAAKKLRELAEETRIDPDRVKKLAEQIDEANRKIDEARRQFGR